MNILCKFYNKKEVSIGDLFSDQTLFFIGKLVAKIYGFIIISLLMTYLFDKYLNIEPTSFAFIFINGIIGVIILRFAFDISKYVYKNRYRIANITITTCKNGDN